MKHFYLPGAPLNLTCDKALTGNVLMMKLCWLMCCHTEVSKGSCERLTFCQPNPSWTSTSPLPLEYRPHRHHHQNNYSHHHRPHVILSATVRFSHSSITFLPVCFWTDYSLSSSHLSFSLFLSLSIFFFYLSKQVIHPVWLSLLCSPCYLSVVLITKGDHPLSSSTRSELPSPADWWVWEGGCRHADNFFWAETY